MTTIESRFHVGAKGSLTKTITEQAVREFANLTGDTQPLHLDPNYAGQTRFQKQVAHGTLLVGLISGVLGVNMAGPDYTVVFLGQTSRFVLPVFFGDTITATCEVTNVRADKPIVTLSCKCTNQNGEDVLTGDATILVDAFPYIK